MCQAWLNLRARAFSAAVSGAGTGLCGHRMNVGQFHVIVGKANEKEVASEDEGTREMLI